MKKIALFALLAFLAAPAYADTAPAPTAAPPHPATARQIAQRHRMKECVAEYHARKIAKTDYHKFMSGCLKGKKGARPGI